MKAIDDVEIDFLNGNVDTLKYRKCPICGGSLIFSIYKGKEQFAKPPGRRYQAGISIYCIGTCNTMLSHLDGFCPSWAEDIEDWDEFSENLYR